MEISFRVRYAVIPDGLGSFACCKAGVVYIDESTFRSVKDMNQIIHEFIHLGWNAVADSETQRARFFDEAFTSYFEARTMQHITGEDYILRRAAASFRNSIASSKYKLVPICEFAGHEYGDLSYTLGALCLHELCTLVGEETFDRATTRFLEKYAHTPVNLDTFCQEYRLLCGPAHEQAVAQFFADWIFSCRGYQKYL